MLEQLGPAVNANKAIFLYGPPGNGKTVIAEGLGRTIGGDMYMPHAIEVDGHIITMFDPINHQRARRRTSRARSSVIAAAPRDRRWVRIRRPVVMVGGELTLDMLDLTFNPLVEVLRGAAPAEGQRRRVPGGRLRPAADAAARIC